MNFSANPPDAALLRIFKKSFDESAANAFASPLRVHKQSDDIHCFATKLGSPLIGTVGITTESSLFVLGYDNKSAIP